MKKRKALILSIKIILVIVIIIVFFVLNLLIDDKKIKEFEYMGDLNLYAYQVEEIGVDGDDFVIKGWFFELKNIKNIPREIDDNKKLGIVLYDINANAETYVDGTKKPNKGIACNVTKTIRPEINEYYKCEFDYSNCGFIARAKKSEIDIEKGQYNLVIKPEQDIAYGIQTNTYINMGTLQYYNPKDQVVLDIKGTALEEIVNNGYCLASSPENHVVLYQYGERLFWITEEGFYFEDDGSTPIRFHADTTQLDRLPKEQTDKDLYWGEESFEFENYEITANIDCGNYRVCVYDLPNDYAITQAETGYYINGEWKWLKKFRPVYLYRNR